MSRVSVIVPCFNYGLYLPDCVQSVLTQEGVDVSVLVIDDASDDDTPDVAARIAHADPRVQLRRHPVNLGHIATYNEGLEWADGDYTVLLSADDLLTPGALLRASTLMDAHEEVGFVYGRGISFYDVSTRGRHVVDAGWTIVPGSAWLEGRFDRQASAISTPSVVVRTSVQRRVGGYNPALPHTGDFEMWMRFALEGDVGVLEADQAWYRLHPASMSRVRFADPVANIEQQQEAIDSLFESHAHQLTDKALLFRRSREALARESLTRARDELDHGVAADSESVDALIELAQRLYPESTSLPEHAAVRRRIWMGPRLCARFRRIRTAGYLLRHPRKLGTIRNLRRGAVEVPS